MTAGVAGVHVVVPARDEEELLPRHLASLRASVHTLAVARPEIPVRVTLVLDSCTDSSASVVARHAWVDAVEVTEGVVGEVRRAGVERARRRWEGRPQDLWVACTDADTAVPPGWLVEQVALADRGCELVLGTVHPDTDDVSPALLSAWLGRHRLREGHPHVHGANLGFTLAAYDRVGGFAPLRVGEDTDLVSRMRAAGVRTVATARTQVTTSGRRAGRAPAGFAAYLLGLEA